MARLYDRLGDTTGKREREAGQPSDGCGFGMLHRFLSAYRLSILVGAILGVIFGDWIFPTLEEAWGDPISDIFFGIVGAVLAALIYEIITQLRNLD